MKRMIVVGHGGYAEGVRLNMEMIAGVPEQMYFFDLRKGEDLADLENRIKTQLESFGADEVLFACDLLGASPFRVAAMQCAEHPGRYFAVAGLNTMAFLETSMNLDSELSIEELANLSMETAKTAIARFPE
ncbi:PTS sugar transporter subunit IIA [Anoxybacterium hadale]|uniref:PTS sugar transporter subunit IIA n=1 Tax=Anoxybacterium hadale TaxID=3408580 RepID=A0ACD1ACS6_9FIRM|nr:PTS sugar transporter subunit IIA [Clostridiales bacterium]